MLTDAQKKEYQKLPLYQINGALLSAAYEGKLEVFEYILLSKDFSLKKNDDKYWYLDLSTCLEVCASKGHLEIVELLSTNSTILAHIDIHKNIDKAFLEAYSNNHLHVAKFLLTSEKLNVHANIHAQKDKAFIYCCATNKIDFINFFIFDYQITRTKEINNASIRLIDGNQDILALFDKREINNKLQQDLNNNDKKNMMTCISKVKI